MHDAPPEGFRAGGLRLWNETVGANPELAHHHLVTLEEMCRIKDRLDSLALALEDDEHLVRGIAGELEDGVVEVKIVVDGALSEARQQANIFKQLLASLRLPDEATGARPQQRGPRGAYQPRTGGTSGKVSSLDRARAAKTGS